MTEIDKKPKRKRRWLRFSLRTFLIVMALLCVWLAWFVYRVERQKKVVRWIEENGGIVHYKHQEIADNGLPIRDRSLRVPKLLIDVFGMDYFSCVTAVAFFDSNVDDISPLESLNELEYLSLKDSQVSDLSPLRGLEKLEELNLRGTEVSDLRPLSTLKSLMILYIDETNVADISPLAELTCLKQLYAADTQIGDTRPFATMDSLEDLSLRGTNIVELTSFAALTNLRMLDIESTSITETQYNDLKSQLPNCWIKYIELDLVFPK